MARSVRRWACAAALAALPLTNVFAATEVPATASVAPVSGYPGARLVATYTFTSKSSCAAYHGQVVWSFGSTASWATGPSPTGTGGTCSSSTPAIAPPSGDGPGSYRICGVDASVTSASACATYTIRPA